MNGIAGIANVPEQVVTRWDAHAQSSAALTAKSHRTIPRSKWVSDG